MDIDILLHALTDGGERGYSRRMAIRTVIIPTIIVLLFGFFDEQILTGLGISIASLRVAGGLLLFYTAFGMVTRTACARIANNGAMIELSASTNANTAYYP